MPFTRRTLLQSTSAALAGSLLGGRRGVLFGDEPAESPTLEWRDGDRCVLLGGAFIERLQWYGYVESILATGLRKQGVTFRNLGWSGDTVWGEARAVFGGPNDGFARLVKDVKECKPTVILVNYGANEAHAGTEGVEAFVAGLNRLLDSLGPTQARLALVSPYARESLPAPLPDPTTYNDNLRAYCDAMAQVARQRRLPFIDLYDLLENPPVLADDQGEHAIRMTENGQHLTELGQAVIAPRLALRLNAPVPTWQVRMAVDRATVDARNAAVRDVQRSPNAVSFTAVSELIPAPPAYRNRGPVSIAHPDHRPQPVRFPQTEPRLQVAGLAPGKYVLKIDGVERARGDQDDWADGIRFSIPADLEQAESLRMAIGEKNQLFFHRYRPQNETYLFLFRKHEQGNNAVEIPQFDPLIAEKEKQIRSLAEPKPHRFELTRTE